MSDSKISLEPHVMTRLVTLYYYIYEMAQSFGVEPNTLDTIEKGILQRRILREIIIYYENANNAIVGRITIQIDWEKHKLLASSDYGSLFALDPRKSLLSQVSEVSQIIIEHVKNMRQALGIKEISTSYRYIPEIERDELKYKEAMQYLGHHIPKEDAQTSIQKEFASSIEWLCDKLKELKIIIESNDPL